MHWLCRVLCPPPIATPAPRHTPPSLKVWSLKDSNQALVLRVKQLEGVVVGQKDALRGLQAQVAALPAAQGAGAAAAQPNPQIQLPQPAPAHGGGGGSGSQRTTGGSGGPVASFPVNLTPGSSPDRSGGGVGGLALSAARARATAGEAGSGSGGAVQVASAGPSSGGGGSGVAAPSSTPTAGMGGGGKFWSMYQ